MEAIKIPSQDETIDTIDPWITYNFNVTDLHYALTRRRLRESCAIRGCADVAKTLPYVPANNVPRRRVRL